MNYQRVSIVRENTGKAMMQANIFARVGLPLTLDEGKPKNSHQSSDDHCLTYTCSSSAYLHLFMLVTNK